MGRRPAVSRVQGDSGPTWSQWLVVSGKVQLALGNGTQPWLGRRERRANREPRPIRGSSLQCRVDSAWRLRPPQDPQCPPTEALSVPTSKATCPPAKLSSPKGGIHSVRWCWVRAESVQCLKLPPREERSQWGWDLGVSSWKES